MPDKKQQPPKKEKKPIVVTDKNDPRYIAYQDSLVLSNSSEKSLYVLKTKINPLLKAGKTKEAYNYWKEEMKDTPEVDKAWEGLKTLNKKTPKGEMVESKYNKEFGVNRFKAPKQSVILEKVQPREKQTPLVNPIKIEDEQYTPINSTKEVNPVIRSPKKYKVETSGGGKFGGWTRTEEVTDFDNISTDKGNKRIITPMYALGGNIQQTNNMNNITTYNEGGLHETNPNGGIPMGQSPEGQMNTVEQGEARMGDMIYSNRIPLSQEAVEAVGLPRKFIGKTPGDILSLIDKTFKGRNDQPSQATKKDIADKVAQAQEMIKAQQEAMQTQSQEVPDMMNGKIPEGMNQFVEGGDITQNTLPLAGLDDLAGGLTSLAVGNKDQALTQGITGGLTLAGTAIAGPLGGFVGKTIADIGTGFINKEKAEKEAQKQAVVNAKIQGSQYTSDFKLGGKMYAGGGDGQFSKSAASYDATKLNIPATNDFLQNLNYVKNLQKQTPVTLSQEDLNQKSGYSNPEIAPKNNKSNIDWNKIGKFAKDNYGNAMRLAPVVMNLAELARLKKNGYDKVNPVLNDTKFKPEYIDEKSLINLANSEMNNTINAISQSGASQGQMRNEIKAIGLNKNKALSEGMINTQAKNIATDQFGQQFDNQNTEANIQRMGIAEDLTARNKGAYETNRSKLVGQLGTDTGSIGKEEVFKKIAENMTGYDWLGNYLKINPNATKEQVTAAAQEEMKKRQTTTSAYGGKMKFKKY